MSAGRTILIDTREQTPLPISGPVERTTLYSGDYSIKGLEHLFAVERKSLDDLMQSLTAGRERFERELHRLRGFRFKRLLIIGSEDAVINHRYRSRISPKAALHSLYAIEARFDIPVVFSPSPASGAILIERWAYWYSRETVNNAQLAVNSGEFRVNIEPASLDKMVSSPPILPAATAKI